MERIFDCNEVRNLGMSTHERVVDWVAKGINVAVTLDHMMEVLRGLEEEVDGFKEKLWAIWIRRLNGR